MPLPNSATNGNNSTAGTGAEVESPLEHSPCDALDPDFRPAEAALPCQGTEATTFELRLATEAPCSSGRLTNDGPCLKSEATGASAYALAVAREDSQATAFQPQSAAIAAEAAPLQCLPAADASLIYAASGATRVTHLALTQDCTCGTLLALQRASAASQPEPRRVCGDHVAEAYAEVLAHCSDASSSSGGVYNQL